MSAPLEGYRVIDLTTVVLGPVATQRLGDLGADVIKVEAPGGDPCRSLGLPHQREMGAVFLNMNRNKRSVVLDLKREAARAALMRLIESADVFTHNMRPKAAARLGLTPQALRAVNPRLIFAAAYGFRAHGPYGDRPAYDDMIQAASGIAANQAGEDGVPAYMKSMIADKVTGLELAQAIVTALLHRERTGEGQAVEVPMFETMTAFITAEQLVGKLYDPPRGPSGYNRVRSKSRRPYRTADGWIGVLPYNDKQWRGFFRLIGRDDLNDDPKFATFEGRLANIDEVYAFLGDELTRRTTAEWMAALEEAEIPAMPANGIDDLLDDEHLNAVGFWRRMAHPSEGDLWMADFPWTMEASPASIRRLAPRLGEHTEEALAEVGMTTAEITAAMEK